MVLFKSFVVGVLAKAAVFGFAAAGETEGADGTVDRVDACLWTVVTGWTVDAFIFGCFILIFTRGTWYHGDAVAVVTDFARSVVVVFYRSRTLCSAAAVVSSFALFTRDNIHSFVLTIVSGGT